ncbi:MAG: YqiJ family protein [Polaromonas sp.]|uniref:YqiJ family protein n=1 Tax=Polaromonas sp. TaxID=1869339 RepID=UPI0032644557
MVIFTAPETWPFGAALAVMVGLSIVEGAGLILAYSPSGLLDSFLPDTPDGMDGPLGWLHVGKVPLLVLLILFLAGFAVSGYVIQSAANALLGSLLPAWIASIPALLAGISTVNGIGGLLAKIIPGDETSAVSEQTLVGRAGVIVKGHARDGMAAEAKVRDSHGRAHYVMVEPDIIDQTLDEGTPIVLVRKAGARFKCIRNPHPELL